MAFDPGFLFYDACNQERSQVTCRTYCLFNVQLSANWTLYVTGLRPFLRSLWDIQSLVSPTLWQLTTCTSHVPDWESVHPANRLRWTADTFYPLHVSGYMVASILGHLQVVPSG